MNKSMNNIQANLIYRQDLEKWLDDTSVPLSNDDMKAMSAYFDSESFQLPNICLFDTINIDDKIRKQAK